MPHSCNCPGNRTYRENTVADALGKHFDELYGNDAIQRLKDLERGSLNAGKTAVTDKSFAECWSLDPTGNWKGYLEDTDGDSTWDLNQSRTSNDVNEISDITESAGPSWITPAYSQAGNMTTMPQPADATSSYTASYDAWNRLVKIVDGANTVTEYEYDGSKRQTIQKTYASGSLDETRHLYYSNNWQILERRIDAETDPQVQNIWGLRYIDDCVLRDRDTTNNGTLDERLYALQDANWNVDALVNSSGVVQERFTYSAYGTPEFLNASFVAQSSSASNWKTLYAGYRWDDMTELFHVRNRVYHSGLGTWVQRDPLGLSAGFNLYEYASGFPAIAVDPFGLVEITCHCRCTTVDEYTILDTYSSDVTITVPPGQTGDTACRAACRDEGSDGWDNETGTATACSSRGWNIVGAGEDSDVTFCCSRSDCRYDCLRANRVNAVLCATFCLAFGPAGSPGWLFCNNSCLAASEAGFILCVALCQLCKLD